MRESEGEKEYIESISRVAISVRRHVYLSLGLKIFILLCLCKCPPLHFFSSFFLEIHLISSIILFLFLQFILGEHLALLSHLSFESVFFSNYIF